MRFEARFYLIKTIVTQKLESQKNKREALLPNLRSLVLMATAAVLWGISGNIAQTLFQAYYITPQWLVAFRALVVGIVLYALLRPSFPRKHILRLFFFAVVGFTGFQIFYYLAIAYTSAPIATLLEFLSIPLMVFYETVVDKSHLSRTKIAVIFLAVIGTTLLSFGDAHGLRLVISPLGLIFGLLAAIAAAIHPLAGIPLVRDYGAWNMTTWGFLIGGIAMSFWTPPWNVHPTGNITIIILLILFVIVFGTLIGYGLYMNSLKLLSASEANIVGLIEPLTSALVGILVTHEFMTPLQYFGALIILGAIVILQVFEKNQHN